MYYSALCFITSDELRIFKQMHFSTSSLLKFSFSWHQSHSLSIYSSLRYRYRYGHRQFSTSPLQYLFHRYFIVRKVAEIFYDFSEQDLLFSRGQRILIWEDWTIFISNGTFNIVAAMPPITYALPAVRGKCKEDSHQSVSSFCSDSWSERVFGGENLFL